MKKRQFLPLIERAWLLSKKYELLEARQLDESLAHNSMSFLLSEKDSSAKQMTKDVNDAADKAIAELDALTGKIPAGKLPNTTEALERAKSEIASARLKAGSTMLNLIGDPITKAMRIFTNVQILGGSIASAFSIVAKSLGDLDAGIAKEDENKTIGELIDGAAAGDKSQGSIPGKDDFTKAIANALEPPEGLFGGVGQLFKKAIGAFYKRGARDVGFGLTQEGFTEDIMDLTIKEANDFIDSAKPTLTDLGDADADSPIQTLDDAMADQGIDSEDELSGDAPIEGGTQSSSSGPLDLSDDHLEAISKAIQGGGKVTGKVLNQLAKSKVFSEHASYGYDEAVYILESHASINRSLLLQVSEREDARRRINEEKLIKRRLLKMANVT